MIRTSERRVTIARRKFHRFVFCAAGIYNIAWGLYSVWDPQWLFRYSGLPLQNHPQIFACRGMVVGLYGIIYFEVARVSERGWLLAAVGLTGKVLGPIGLFQLIWSGTWPPATIVLSLTRSNLVDSFRALSLRRLACVSAGCFRKRGPRRFWTNFKLGLKFELISNKRSLDVLWQKHSAWLNAWAW
ncbi:MAG: hypothetical protein ACRD9S_06505 [Pyrinomonadaceae bacterium]